MSVSAASSLFALILEMPLSGGTDAIASAATAAVSGTDVNECLDGDDAAALRIDLPAGEGGGSGEIPLTMSAASNGLRFICCCSTCCACNNCC